MASTAETQGAPSTSRVGKVKEWTNRHKAYNPLKPCSNKLLKLKWDMRAREIHQQKLKEVRSTIDNRPPKTYTHLHLKLKKLQIEEERLTTIERNNRILLEKMSHIMRQANTIDNRNTYAHKSLNKTQRQRELLRITHENQAILKRIQSKQPHYSHMQWEDERNVNEGYLRNISSYNFEVGAQDGISGDPSPFRADMNPPTKKRSDLKTEPAAPSEPTAAETTFAEDDKELEAPEVEPPAATTPDSAEDEPAQAAEEPSPPVDEPEVAAIEPVPAAEEPAAAGDNSEAPESPAEESPAEDEAAEEETPAESAAPVGVAPAEEQPAPEAPEAPEAEEAEEAPEAEGAAPEAEAEAEPVEATEEPVAEPTEEATPEPEVKAVEGEAVPEAAPSAPAEEDATAAEASPDAAET